MPPTKDDRVYSAAEHEAIVTDAVARETARVADENASRITELETEKAELLAKVDTLESEKSALEQAKEKAETDLADFKAEQERAAEVEDRKADRIAAVRAISAHDLTDEYLTDARVTRWAEMADEAFTDLVDTMVEATVASFTEEEAKGLDDLSGDERRDKVASIVASRKEQAGAAAGAADPAHRVETAAFTGGQSPSDPKNTGPSLLTQVLRPAVKSS